MGDAVHAINEPQMYMASTAVTGITVAMRSQHEKGKVGWLDVVAKAKSTKHDFIDLGMWDKKLLRSELIPEDHKQGLSDIIEKKEPDSLV